MRGMFALVLVSAIAAGAAMVLWDDGTGDSVPPSIEAGAAAESVVQNPNVPAPPPADAGTQRPSPTRSDAVVARVRGELSAGRPAGAAREILAAEAGLLAESAFVDAAFETASALEKSASGLSGTAAVDARVSARRLLASVFDSEAVSDADLDRAFAGCQRLNEILVEGAAAPEPIVMRHKIAPGEILWNLSKGAWKSAGVTVPPGFILHVNGISDARRIRAGQTLRVPREPLSLLIRKRKFELVVLLGGVPYARFPVGLGANASTPEGVFRIETKIQNPDWYYGGKRIAFGDPENLIGTRWMGFAGDAQAEGIGIHGTVDESSVGQAVSMGCIRMRRDDVEQLFEWVPYGADVEIR